MHPTFKFKTLFIAITSFGAASLAGAAGLDRSGQDTTAFFQDGTYFEASYSYIDASLTGHDNQTVNGDYAKGNSIDDIAEYYDFARFGVKTDVNDMISVGVLYDQPFGAAAHYKGDNNFVGNLYSPSTENNETKVEVNSYNLTGLVGVNIGENFQVYGGPALQRVEADLQLRGAAYGGSSGYDAHISPDNEVGWVAGIAFKKPEIALKAALTYRSEIEHENSINESLAILGLPAGAPYPLSQAAKDIVNNAADQNGRGTLEITTPESFNFDFQTGINPTTLATAHVRYVPWSEFSITPPLYNALSQLATIPQGSYDGLPLVNYADDQWKVELGLAKRVTPRLALSGNIGWDSGAGNPVTSLGPLEGYYSVGAGAKFNITENWAVSAGAKYLMFGDAKGALPNGNVVANFEDNDGYIAGIRLSYQEK